MKKYQVIRHWISGKPIDQNDFEQPFELYDIPMIKEYMLKNCFQEIIWDSIYCMPSTGPHYSTFELVAKFSDGHSERICWINEVDGLGLKMKPFEMAGPSLI
jgi:hypothetical protein